MSDAGSGPDLGELRRTVERMERRLSETPDPSVEPLMRAYTELVPRFERDLPDERDVLLSRGAALMLIQEMLGP